MKTSCSIVPKVRNKKEQIVDSKLFTDLLSISPSRQEARKFYLITKNPKFIDRFGDKLKMDENGEPTLKSLLDNTDFKDSIQEDAVIRALNIEVGHIDEKGNIKTSIDTRDNYNRLVDKADEWNRLSEFNTDYVAVVNRSISEGKSTLNIEIVRKDSESEARAREAKATVTLNKNLRDILLANNVSIEAINSIEERAGVTGVTDFEQLKNIGKGLIALIRLADNSLGEQALPEEFAHFAIEALSQEPLVRRLIAYIRDNNLTESLLGNEYDTYNKKYKGNESLLLKEAAGKLLAKHLVEYQLTGQVKANTGLINRVITLIKNFFKKFKEEPIIKAINEANNIAAGLAGGILDGSINNYRFENIQLKEKLYHLEDRAERGKKLLEDILDVEQKRFNIYKKRANAEAFRNVTRNTMDKLKRALLVNDFKLGIEEYVTEVVRNLSNLQNRLEAVINDSSKTPIQKATVLRDVRNYVASYKAVTTLMYDDMAHEQEFNGDRYSEMAKQHLRETQEALQLLEANYKKYSKEVFIKGMKPYFGDTKVYEGRKGTVKIELDENFLAKAEHDISIFDRYLDSAADCRDPFINLIDHAVKVQKESDRLDIIKDIKEIQKAGEIFLKSGSQDFEWMFEKDADGNKTGRYIRKIDNEKYSAAYKAMLQEALRKYGSHPEGEAAVQQMEFINNWIKDNRDSTTRKPKVTLYASESYLSLNDAQRTFYDAIMSMKEKLDGYLPKGTTYTRNAIKIRKSLLERFISDPTKVGTNIWESAKDLWQLRSDDEDLISPALTDFEGREVHGLPIYYVAMREGESANDISTDVIQTMCAYAAMANNYRGMSKIIDILELGREIANSREIGDTRGIDKHVVTPVRDISGKIIKYVKKTKSADQTKNVVERLNDYMEAQVYGRYMKDEGTLGNTKIEKGKAANLINSMTALNSFALNVVAGISNITTGTVMGAIEAVANEYFSPSDLLKADGIYAANMPECMSNMPKRVKTDKLSLFMELFNVRQEFERDATEVKATKALFRRVFSGSILFLTNDCGEHWLQTRTALALANRFKMKDKNNNECTLWDALKIKYIDPSNKNLGAELVIKEGYTKTNGQAFTKEDIAAFTLKAKAINQKMHGIYNKLDQSAIQRLALGRMALMYRKYLRPSLNKRWGRLHYNFDLQDWEEGYYNVLGGFLLTMGKDLIHSQFRLTANWNSLNTKEKKAIRRAITELSVLFILFLLTQFMDWPDDESAAMAELQCRRLYTEIGALTPTPAFVLEGIKLLQNPAAGVNTFKTYFGIIRVLWPYNYEAFGGEDAILQSGRYEGHSKAFKAAAEAFPLHEQIYRTIHPEESIPFYKQ